MVFNFSSLQVGIKLGIPPPPLSPLFPPLSSAYLGEGPDGDQEHSANMIFEKHNLSPPRHLHLEIKLKDAPTQGRVS